ncbi:hypothetical protein ACFWY5_29840 [Nonomuraea sp. NPDC059007]|uniref:hypothetical protein n=1 Tax=Nonomuraea sp. NPDC059007 TaxID=3346692 RepID=UPI0036B2DB07
MTERSYPFDAGDGAAINEAQWSYLAGGWQDDGVESPGPWNTALRVSATGQPNTLRVTAGHAKLAGIHYHLDADLTALYDSNATSLPRVDRVVLRLDREANRITVVVKKGAPAASPVLPPVDRSWNSPEIPLASVTVKANTNIVVPADVVDCREFTSNGVQVLSTAAASTGSRQLVEGQMGYDPTAGKFYAQEKTQRIQIGDATKAELANYATKNHTHSYMPNTVTSGSVSAMSGWSSAARWTKIGNIVQVAGRLSATQDNPSTSNVFTLPLETIPVLSGVEFPAVDPSYVETAIVTIYADYNGGSSPQRTLGQIYHKKQLTSGMGFLFNITYITP